MTIKRLVGQRVSIATQGAPMHVRSAYGENLQARTGVGGVGLGN